MTEENNRRQAQPRSAPKRLVNFVVTRAILCSLLNWRSPSHFYPPAKQLDRFMRTYIVLNMVNMAMVHNPQGPCLRKLRIEMLDPNLDET